MRPGAFDGNSEKNKMIHDAASIQSEPDDIQSVGVSVARVDSMARQGLKIEGHPSMEGFGGGDRPNSLHGDSSPIEATGPSLELGLFGMRASPFLWVPSGVTLAEQLSALKAEHAAGMARLRLADDGRCAP
jgi:hypothetical protein